MLPEKVVMPTSIGEIPDRSTHPRPTKMGNAIGACDVRLTVWNFPGPLIHLCSCFCPEFALPLSIWLSCGRIGLRLHWRAELAAAGLPWRVMRLEGRRSTV